MSSLLSEFVTEQELLQKEVISPEDVLRLPKITEGKYNNSLWYCFLGLYIEQSALGVDRTILNCSFR